jgi:hypothetical protein
MSLEVTIENVKTCNRCKQNKPHYGKVTTKDGLRNPCKDCIREIDRPLRKYRGLMRLGK